MSRIVELGEKHYAATVIVISDSLPAKALLLHHRKLDCWLPPGGHQESHENSVQAAIRETQEETGLDISELIAPVTTYGDVKLFPNPDYLLEESIPPHGDQPAHYHLDQVYVVKVPEQTVQHNQAESHDIGWFTLEETEQLNTFENVHMILRKELAS
jgi:8-oxo-dGTP pyrophosphatase MutT (NUDIX family)